MFYKPNFCCNCGEKVERSDWTLFTSRRFCELCETEKKEHDYFVRCMVGLSLIIGLFGMSGLILGTGNAVPSDKRLGELRLIARSSNAPVILANSPNSPAGDFLNQSPTLTTAARPAKQVDLAKSEEPLYYCGAMTKKGTPCTRRVKTKGKLCWQHAPSSLGMTAETVPAPSRRR